MKKPALYLGIDGEGVGKRDHRYVLLAYSDELGQCRDALQAPLGKRLRTVDCLEFILSTPPEATLFAFAFNYDLTKFLADVPNRDLFHLFHPELRDHDKGAPWGVRYFPNARDKTRGYVLNLQGGKFSVRRIEDRGKRRATRTVWDVFKFFGCSFVTALEKWSVGTKEERERVARMKAVRGRFTEKMMEKVEGYCFDECRLLATLVRELKEAHDGVGLKLKAWYGAGSTGGALLHTMKIAEHKRETPRDMVDPVMRAFFGGRFEHAYWGPIRKKVWGWDINSAYPYQAFLLPCLNHARWTRTKSELRACNARHALVRYAIEAPIESTWGPFPFRESDGSICFPVDSRGGWVWREEFLQAQALFPEVLFREAYVLESDCACQPFARMSEYYLERLAWGKDGKGLTLKNGMNAGSYGKLAQSEGSPQFQSWIWAGMITSGTRAQLLELMAAHRNLDSVLGTATDGLYTTENIVPPRPKTTGTEGTDKPLGAWGLKELAKGMFLARPGLYFPLGGGELVERETRGRGIGKKTMRSAIPLFMRAWREGAERVITPKVPRFWGARSSLRQLIRGDAMNGYAHVYRRDAKYGQWTREPFEVSFDPMPKRGGVDGQRLLVRTMPRELESAPYDADVISSDAQIMIEQKIVDGEQPDWEE